MLRPQMRGLRRTLARAAPDAGERAAEYFPTADLGVPAVVAGYRARGSEIDPWPLMRRLAEAGARLTLPVAVDRDSPLAFRAYAPGDVLAPDGFGIPAPLATAPELEPDLVIVPLLAFDAQGGRMGQGAGHYDRTLAALRARKPVWVLGLAHAGQQIARVPAEPHDQRLDAILTEKGYIDAQRDY